MFFEVADVQLHQAEQQPLALPVLCTGHTGIATPRLRMTPPSTTMQPMNSSVAVTMPERQVLSWVPFMVR